MLSHVHLKILRSDKRLHARGTAEREVSGVVRRLVKLQVGQAGKSLGAVGTAERPLARVASHVLLQMIVPAK